MAIPGVLEGQTEAGVRGEGVLVTADPAPERTEIQKQRVKPLDTKESGKTNMVEYRNSLEFNADEPSGSLNSNRGADILIILDRVPSKGKTLIVVTRDEGIATRAQHVIGLGSLTDV